MIEAYTFCSAAPSVPGQGEIGPARGRNAEVGDIPAIAIRHAARSTLLSVRELSCRIRDGEIFPTWLGEDDAAWVSAMLDEIAARSGGTRLSIDGFVKASLAQRLPRRHPPRVVEALWAVERRRWESRVAAPVEPETLRDTLFSAAARTAKEDALAAVAASLGAAPAEVVSWLFADRARARILVAPAERTDPAAPDARLARRAVRAQDGLAVERGDRGGRLRPEHAPSGLLARVPPRSRVRRRRTVCDAELSREEARRRACAPCAVPRLRRRPLHRRGDGRFGPLRLSRVDRHERAARGRRGRAR